MFNALTRQMGRAELQPLERSHSANNGQVSVGEPGAGNVELLNLVEVWPRGDLIAREAVALNLKAFQLAKGSACGKGCLLIIDVAGQPTPGRPRINRYVANLAQPMVSNALTQPCREQVLVVGRLMPVLNRAAA